MPPIIRIEGTDRQVYETMLELRRHRIPSCLPRRMFSGVCNSRGLIAAWEKYDRDDGDTNVNLMVRERDIVLVRLISECAVTETMR
ncbi:MAG: hypothetical protein EOO77_21500 [Oxalobacteraceae bacterium]|nr:MAG: hypothetical protein EOO77_21500 [Oxalobacteraceae bacterium]